MKGGSEGRALYWPLLDLHALMHPREMALHPP